MATIIRKQDFKAKEFGLLLRYWMASRNINVMDILRMLEAEGYDISHKTLYRLHNGEARRMPPGFVHFLGKVSDLPETYWTGEHEISKMVEELGNSLVVERRTLDP